MWIWALSQGQTGEINPALILSALAGNFTIMELIDEGWFPEKQYDYFKNNNIIINTEIIGYIRFPTQKKAT